MYNYIIVFFNNTVNYFLLKTDFSLCLWFYQRLHKRKEAVENRCFLNKWRGESNGRQRKGARSEWEVCRD